MTYNYEKAFALLIQLEGGFSDNPNDSGGATFYGISSVFYPKEYKEIMALKTKEERLAYAKKFYKKTFWDDLSCDNLPTGLDFAAFDFAVHSGQTRAKNMLTKTDNWQEYIRLRMRFLVSISAGKNLVFLGGWINRCLILWEAIIKEREKNKERICS